ncbi:pirin domain-containing protein [Pseudomonas sp. BAY1663]|nr:pirin domain-containing protein [Pseudomonas sp. BAY1663]
MLGATLKAGETLEYRFADASRHGYLVPAKGTVAVNGVALQARDGAAIHGEELIRISASEDAELVLVDAAS